MEKKRRTIQVDFAKLENQPYRLLNATGKTITNAMIDISSGVRDKIGRRLPEKPTEAQKAMLDMVSEAFKELTPKQKRVLTLVFGLDGSPPSTEREIAEIMGISPHSAHDLKLRATKALRKKAKLNFEALKKISQK